MPDIDEYLSALNNSSKFGPQVVFHKKIPGKKPCYAKKLPAISKIILDLLRQRGVKKLFTHQQDAINRILSGDDVIVATPTASGKSLIYNLPSLHLTTLEDRYHCLYLFPLKALAQDQYKNLLNLFDCLPEKIKENHQNFAALFDGDTNSYQRRKLRDTPPDILFSNPEMLHLSLLPYHQNWINFFSRLKYVVIDEVHSYRGVLGSHMAWLIKRLQRIAQYYGANPQFILLSATIGNPEQLGEKLIGKEVSVVTQSGAPSAEKNMVFLNPWDSAAYAAGQLLEAAVKRDLRTIVYTQSRKMTELIQLWTSPRLGKKANKLSAYRAGFLPEERREIEGKLFDGELLGVISTSALELGVDIGDLDLCILVGYPGSITSTWQRGGRVGRSMRKSAIILVAQEDALDQHFMNHPEDFFVRQPEDAILNPKNKSIAEKQLICCAAELPLTEVEDLATEESYKKRIQELCAKGSLLETVDGGTWVSSRKYPQREVVLRGGSNQMSIIDESSGEIVGEIDMGRGLKECHTGAIYLHRAVTWIVTDFNIHGHEVLVKQEKPNYFTNPTVEKQTEILEIAKTKSHLGLRVNFGTLKVRERVTGYQKRNSHTQKIVSRIALDLPEQTIETEGVWIDIPSDVVKKIEEQKLHFMGAIHAMEHAIIALFPLLVLCDRNDIGGISCPLHEQTQSASVFVYDGYPGGVGLAEKGYEKIDAVMKQTLAAVKRCSCENGCPSCVHSPKCGSGNRPIDKMACITLLEEIYNNQRVTENEQKSDFSIVPLQNVQKAPSRITLSKHDLNQPAGLDALPGHFGVFDLETIRSAEEVGGWGKVDRMGVSVGVIYDGAVGKYFTYLENEVDALVAHLERLELVVGFNNKRFDNQVLSSYTKVALHKLPTLDLLEEVHKYLGYRLSLNGLASKTLGVKKSADGLQALKWYKEGRIDLIRKYCQKDVEITRDLLFFCLEKGYLLFQNKAKQTVRLPLAVDRSINKILSNRNDESVTTSRG